MNAIEIANEALPRAAAALTGEGKAYGFAFDSPQWKVDGGGILRPELVAAEIINAALAAMPETAPWDADHKERWAEWLEATAILEKFATENKIEKHTNL